MSPLPDTSVTVIGCVLACILVGGGCGLVAWWRDALPKTLWVVGFLAVIMLVGLDNHCSALRRLSQGRTGDPLCNFARAFDTRQVDTWVIRAVWDALQSCVMRKSDPFPFLPEDRISEDLGIDSEDLTDIVTDVAERAGYSGDDFELNPMCGKVETVGDLVLFVNQQPSLHRRRVG